MIPKPIQSLIAAKTGHTDNIGMSGSSVILYDDCVLKIEERNAHTESTVATMRWLEGKVPVPKVLCHEILDGKSYLLMSRVPGIMSCDASYLEQPDVLVSALADGLKLLWNTDTAGCPRTWMLEALLEEAKIRVAQGLVDLDNVEPETFSENGFRDPEHLLQWLLEHKPNSVPTLAHGDYCLPNVFLKDGKLSGFIDVGDMGLGEKWRDIALCYRSLRHNFNGTYGGKIYNAFHPDLLFKKLGIQPDWEQIRYHLLLDELF